MKNISFVTGLILLVLLPGSLSLYAQSDSFTVLAVGGNVSFTKAGSSAWKHLNTGDQLSGDFKIKIDKNSYAGLIYSNGRAFELNKPGVYESKWLRNSISNNTSSGKKFAEFVLNVITKKIVNTKQMKVTGAVVRERMNDIPVGIPPSTYLLDSVVVFSWYPVDSCSYYTFKLINGDNKTVYLKRVQDTTISINFNSLQINDDSYKWLIINYDKPEQMSDTNYIFKFTYSKAEAIKDSVEKLNEMIGNQAAALNLIILASFYQRNNLNINALEAYRMAVKLAPKVKAYKIRYNEFVKSMGLDRMVE